MTVASFFRRVAPAAALGGLAVVVVGVADPALAGHTPSTETGAPATVAGEQTPSASNEAPSNDSTQSVPDPLTLSEGTAGSSQDGGSAADGTSGGTDCSTADTVSGDEVMTRWGPVQVTASVAGGTVCAVQAVEWPANDRRSQQINSYAIPQLDAWATASPTQFDYVSGATYTSDGYHQSLQSILDSL